MATSPREPSACTGLPLPFNIILSLENQLIISLTHDAHPPSVKKTHEICRQHGIEDQSHHSLGSLSPARFRRPDEKTRHST